MNLLEQNQQQLHLPLNKMKKANKKIIIWTIVLLLLSMQLVLAIGIRPAKTTIISGEENKFENSFWIVNNDHRDFFVKLYPSGPLAEYISLEVTELNFLSTYEAKEVKYIVMIPKTIPPGLTKNYLIVEEELLSTDPTVISSKILLKHKILIQGEYPDKYVEVKLNFRDLGSDVEFISEVENLGKQNLTEVKTTFRVNDKYEQEHYLETNVISLEKDENKLLISTLEKDFFELGEYDVSAITEYDDLEVEMVKTLRIGKPEVDITYFNEYFVANKINEYTMDLLNRWNQKVENVFVEVEVKKDDQKIDEFRTKSIDIEGEMSKKINDYFDAKEKNPGIYTFDMVVNFWNTYKMEQKTFQSELMTGAIVIPPESLSDSSLSLTMILFLIIGLLIGVMGGYVLYRYIRRDQYK